MKNNLKKSFFWNTLGSGLNCCNSLFFLIIVTRINGINDAGVFSLSFATACMFYIFATYSGRTYQITETDKSVTDNEYIINRIICSGVMILLSLLFGLINKYYDYKLTIFMLLSLYKASEAICDVFYGILQKNDKLDIVGKSLLIRSLLNVIIFLIIDILTNNLILSCLSLIITNILVMYFIDIRISFKYKEKVDKINKKAIFKIFTFGFYTFGFSILSSYLINIPRYRIDSLFENDIQTIYSIIVMPGTVMLLVGGFIVQPLLIKFKEQIINKDYKLFLKTLNRSVLAVIIFGLVVIILAYLFGIPVLNIIYDIDLTEYVNALLIVLIAFIMQTIVVVFSSALTVLRKTRIQLYIYILVAINAIVISYILVPIYQLNGAIYSYFFTILLLLILYIIYFNIIIRKRKV